MDWANLQQNVAYCQRKARILAPRVTLARASFFYQPRQRFSNRALVITLTELSAMAAPATTGLR